MPDGHIAACLHQETGICTCKEESARYIKLAKLSFLMFLIEAAGGILAGSMALLADAFHTLFDGTENILSAFVAHRARFSDNERRVRKIGGMASAILISIIAWYIGMEALERLNDPTKLHILGAAAMAILAIGVNAWQFLIHEDAPDEHRNITHAWQKIHIVADISGSVAAFIGIMIVWAGFPLADVYVSFAIVLFIWLRAGKYVYMTLSEAVFGDRSKSGKQKHRYYPHGEHRR